MTMHCNNSYATNTNTSRRVRYRWMHLCLCSMSIVLINLTLIRITSSITISTLASAAAGATKDIESESTCNIGIRISLKNANTMDNNAINMNINAVAAAAAAPALSISSASDQMHSSTSPPLPSPTSIGIGMTDSRLSQALIQSSTESTTSTSVPSMGVSIHNGCSNEGSSDDNDTESLSNADNCTIAPRLCPGSRDTVKTKEDNDEDVNSTAISFTSSYCEETENSFKEALQASSIQNLEEGRENGKEGADTITVDIGDNQTCSLPSSTGSGSRSTRSISIMSNPIMIGSGNLLANGNSNACSNDPSLDLKTSSSAASGNETDAVIVDVTDNDIQDEIESENE